MKAKLIFDLPDDQEDFRLATHALRMSCIIEEIKRQLRDIRKYTESPKEKLRKIEELEMYLSQDTAWMEE